MLVFEEGGKSGVPREKPLGARERTNNKLNPHMETTPGTQTILVGGEWSHHCTILGPPKFGITIIAEGFVKWFSCITYVFFLS